MAASKSTRIIILLAIDTVFFLIELITGYAVHSLALVADSFHMLNDVLSLIVGLWAVKAANRTQTAESMRLYTYGYQRAETLGALVNGIFLVALCVTIFLDAIERFINPQEVKNPVIVLIVGCLGLLSNLVGLLLFHDHSHGGHGHSHGGHSHGNEVSDAEEGHAGHERYTDHPEEHAHDHSGHNHDDNATDITAVAEEIPVKAGKRRHSRAASRGLVEDFSGPRGFRDSIITAASRVDEEEAENEDDDGETAPTKSNEPLLANGNKNGYGSTEVQRQSFDHKDHKHRQPREAGKGGGGGHSHGDLNMKGIFLHVMGDALGNLGVIATALIIWLTDFKGRFYFDPAISLVITIIILCSAIPLCRAASRILLQAVPHGIEVDDIKEDIESLAGVESCHHLHVWQLSDTKLIASLHVRVTFNFKAGGSQRYMSLAAAVRRCLHEYGIHNATIQPEFVPSDDEAAGLGESQSSSAASPRTGSVVGDKSCLLDCDEDCGGANKSCCPPVQAKQQDDHAHDGHDHSH